MANEKPMFEPKPLVAGAEYLVLITETAFFDKGDGTYNSAKKSRSWIEVRKKGELNGA